MRAHEKTKKHICQNLMSIGKKLISFCGQQMGFSKLACSPSIRRMDKVIFKPEVSIRYEGLNKNKFGEVKPKRLQLDGVFFIAPSREGLNTVADKRKDFTVGIEIKETANDLSRDTKLLFYLGWTDFFFLVVPANLKEDALKKLKEINDKRIGLIIYSEHEVFKILVGAQRQKVSLSNWGTLANQAVFVPNYFDESAEINELDKQEEDKPVFFNGIRDNYNGTSTNFKELFQNDICDSNGYNYELSGIPTEHSNLSEKEINAMLLKKISSVSEPQIKALLKTLSKNAQRAYFLVEERPFISVKEIAGALRVSNRTAEKVIKTHVNLGMVKRVKIDGKPVLQIGDGPEWGKCPLCSFCSNAEKELFTVICNLCKNNDCYRKKD